MAKRRMMIGFDAYQSRLLWDRLVRSIRNLAGFSLLGAAVVTPRRVDNARELEEWKGLLS